MTAEHWMLIAALAASTIGLRLVGYVAGDAMQRNALARRVLRVFPGCLVVALVATSLARGGPPEWGAAAVALAVAMVTRNLILTMLAGMAAVVGIGAL
ncbi:MAG: AzlD domain-containing protein [Shimia sp.]